MIIFENWKDSEQDSCRLGSSKYLLPFLCDCKIGSLPSKINTVFVKHSLIYLL